ncbi:epoxyqueuosine reductase [Candidatus Poribacteria bacterium]|nr:epoxyqueuosine reductase [Candidatus Poribacteria bacterium]
MSVEELLRKIESYLYQERMDVVGVANAADWSSPMKETIPGEILEDCRSIVVFGKEIPPATFTARNHAAGLYHQIASNYYITMDSVATDVALMLTREGFPSIPLAGQKPMFMRKGKYWGVVSLKHAAVRAGLGTMGRNSLLINEDFGNRLRLAGLLTTAPLPAGKPTGKSHCPEKCRKCVETCPVKALDGSGNIDQYKCLRRSIASPLMGALFLSQWLRSFRSADRNFELTGNTLGSIYVYSCHQCLVSCPHFSRKRNSKREASEQD